MTSEIPLTPKKPGRRSETPQQRMDRLQRDLELARQALKEHQQRTFAAFGAALAEEAKIQPDVMRMVRDIASRRIASKTSLADVQAMLGASE